MILACLLLKWWGLPGGSPSGLCRRESFPLPSLG